MDAFSLTVNGALTILIQELPNAETLGSLCDELKNISLKLWHPEKPYYRTTSHLFINPVKETTICI